VLNNKLKSEQKEMMEKIVKLPEDVCGVIYEFMPFETKAWLTKKEFIAYYRLKIKSMNFNNYAKYDSYIRDMVRNRREITFTLVLRTAFVHWIKPRTWKIDNMSFPDYLSYVRYLIILYDSPRLKSGITDTKNHLGRKSYKKIRSKNISWSN
jgi:hypothetical protein